MEHVALIRRAYVEPILDGRKTVEARLGRVRIPPFGRVGAGDTVHFKAVGGGFVLMARVGWVRESDGLAPGDVRLLEREFGGAVCAERSFWREKRSARWATLISLVDVREIESGPDIAELRRSRPRAAWLVLPAAADVSLPQARAQ